VRIVNQNCFLCQEAEDTNPLQSDPAKLQKALDEAIHHGNRQPQERAAVTQDFEQVVGSQWSVKFTSLKLAPGNTYSNPTDNKHSEIFHCALEWRNPGSMVCSGEETEGDVGRCDGFGFGPRMATASAFFRALDMPAFVAVKVHRSVSCPQHSIKTQSHKNDGSPKKTLKAAVEAFGVPGAEEKSKNSSKPLPLAEKDLRFEEVKAILQSLRQDQALAFGETKLNNDLVKHAASSIGTKLSQLCEALERLLTGKNRVLLDDPGLVILKKIWQYGLASRSREVLRRMAAAIEKACEITAGSLPLDLFTLLGERSTRVAFHSSDNGAGGDELADEAISLISYSLVPTWQHYGAYFQQLLFHERVAELRSRLSETTERLMKMPEWNCNAWMNQNNSRHGDMPRWTVQWIKEEGVHCPKLNLKLSSTGPQRIDFGCLDRGELLLLCPDPPQRGQGVFVEVIKEFNSMPWNNQDSDANSSPPSLPIVRAKLWTSAMLTSPYLEVFQSDQFVIAPMRDSRVTHDRQVQAVMQITCRRSSHFQEDVRNLIYLSWADPRIQTYRPSNSTASMGTHAPEKGLPATLAKVRPNGWNVELEESIESCAVQCTTAQRQAVRFAIGRRCSLVRGPPGTGKTHTACAIVDVWLKMQGSPRVLVVTQSNVAALNIQERLKTCNVPSVRVGPALTAIDLLAQEDFLSLFEDRELEKLRNEAEACHSEDSRRMKQLLMAFQRRATESCQVVVVTCISAGNYNLFPESRFCRVLLDEAAQAIEPTALVPLMSTGADAFVCIGDDKQLPATLLSQKAAKFGLSESLFERLLRTHTVSKDDGFMQLDIQRRMHSSIASFPCKHFYGGFLKNGIEDSSLPAISGFRWPLTCRVVFVDCAQGRSEQGASKSMQNMEEAQALVWILNHLLDECHVPRLQKNDVAVITGYSAQRQVLHQLIARSSGLRQDRSLRIDTVDGFQGMERALVLVSTVRADGEVGFLRDPRRANVLLTRAQRGLIVFGNRHTLASEKTVWAPWLHWVEQMGALIRLEVLHSFLTVEASPW